MYELYSTRGKSGNETESKVNVKEVSLESILKYLLGIEDIILYNYLARKNKTYTADKCLITIFPLFTKRHSYFHFKF